MIKTEDEMKSLSRIKRRTLVLLGLLAFFSMSWVSQPVNTYDSTVVIKVQNLTSEQFNEVAASLGQKDQLNIEYYCLWSGIMVLKLKNSTLHQTGDIHLFTKRMLYDATNLEKVEILHVHTGISGIAKC